MDYGADKSIPFQPDNRGTARQSLGDTFCQSDIPFRALFAKRLLENAFMPLTPPLIAYLNYLQLHPYDVLL